MLHLDACEETTPRHEPGFVYYWERRVLFLPARPRQLALASLLQSNGLEVATGAAFQRIRVECLEKLNGSYARIGTVSRWPLVHPDLCKTPPARDPAYMGA